MPILNYTTQISADKTASEIQKKLAQGGASAILTEYGPTGLVSAISFRILTPHGLLSFRLPANVTGVLAAMKKHPKVALRLCNNDQASRVAWRILKDWVDVQLAMVESGNAELTQVFLSYVQEPQTGQTLFESLKGKGFKMLTSGSS